MASILRAGFTVRAALQRTCRRPMHTTPASFAKKKASFHDAFADDMFAEDGDGDLIVAEPTDSANSAATKPVAPVKADVHKMSSAVRQAKFTNLLDFASPRIQANGLARRQINRSPPYLRKTAFSQLVQLAESPAQLEQISELLPDFTKYNGERFAPYVGEEFARRCVTLNALDVAIKIFGNVPRYQLMLPRDAAHRLLKALLEANRPSDVLLVAAFYDSHSLGPLEEDLSASAIVVLASVRAGHKNVANDLLVALRPALAGPPGEIDPMASKIPWVRHYLPAASRLMESGEGLKKGFTQGWLKEWRISRYDRKGKAKSAPILA